MPDNTHSEPLSLPSPHVERNWDWWTDVISALLLGLAAVASGWAAYQAALWSSEQTFALNDSSSAARKAAALETRSGQLRAIDVGVFLQYLQALAHKDQELSGFLYYRFRPEMKPAVDAWLATKPFSNPDAPLSPFVMQEYRLSTEDEALQFNHSHFESLNAAQHADKNSDKYVLMAVPFAIVSLLAGMCTKFRLRQVRMAVAGLAIVLFIAGALVLASLPRAA